MIPLSGSDLASAKQKATWRYLGVAQSLKLEAGVREHKISTRLAGRAFVHNATILAPKGGTRKQLYIVAHECAHILLRHIGTKPRHVEEYEAEQWAHAALRRHGISVPRAMTKSAKDYVAHKIHQARRRGAKSIDPAALAYVKRKAEPCT